MTIYLYVEEFCSDSVNDKVRTDLSIRKETNVWIWKRIGLWNHCNKTYPFTSPSKFNNLLVDHGPALRLWIINVSGTRCPPVSDK